MRKWILWLMLMAACGNAFASWKIIDSRVDGQDVITTVEFYGVPENKKNKVTLEVRHYRPETLAEVEANISEMEVTAQDPKDKGKEAEVKANEIVEELKVKW
jgi:hypothetical protein